MKGYIYGGLQADPRKQAIEGVGNLAAWILEPADGAHQGDDGCEVVKEVANLETQILGPPGSGASTRMTSLRCLGLGWGS